MRVELLVPDRASQHADPTVDASAFAQALDNAGRLLERATNVEDAYAAGTGSLQQAVYERARADVALSVATATVQRAAQALTSILNMQI